MNTCKYCGTQVKKLINNSSTSTFKCYHCDITFEEHDLCKDRKRKNSVPVSYDKNYYRSTKELLSCRTIELFHLLKECRKDWYDTFKLLNSIYGLDENQMPDQSELDEVTKPLYHEYVLLTKKKFTIENILLEKAGFIPEKLTDEFLSEIIDQGEKASSKPMYIYIKNKNKKKQGELK